MQTTAYLRPTALQHMRGFLADSGAGLPPWSTSEEVMDELVEQLHAHRGDAEFFARLVPFLRDLREHAARGSAGLAASDAEILSRASVEAIVDELQARMREVPRSGAASAACAVLGERAARLLCLALLTSGLGACTQTPTAPASPAEPGVSPPAETAPARETPPPAPKAGAADAGADGLMELFRTKSPQEAAQALERAIDAGRRVDSEPAARYKGVRLPVPDEPRVVPLYKGVIV